eukprot:scaffold2291_cov211-Alexandrium_tamarense.AAC.13
MNNLDIDVDGTPFSVLMDRAVKLKSSQLSSQGSKWDSYPSFYQNTVFPREEAVDEARGLDFNDRLASATPLKDEGNSSFQDGNLDEALVKYESALAVFRYLVNINSSWKNEGIKDDFISEVSFQSKDDEESDKLNEFLVKCYNNIALVSDKRRHFQLALQACDCAIAVDKRCDKSYFHRAQARIAPLSSGSVEQELALADLQTSVKMNGQNKEARKLLHSLRDEIKSQRVRDKQSFSGLFDRGE